MGSKLTEEALSDSAAPPRPRPQPTRGSPAYSLLSSMVFVQPPAVFLSVVVGSARQARSCLESASGGGRLGARSVTGVAPGRTGPISLVFYDRVGGNDPVRHSQLDLDSCRRPADDAAEYHDIRAVESLCERERQWDRVFESRSLRTAQDRVAGMYRLSSPRRVGARAGRRLRGDPRSRASAEFATRKRERSNPTIRNGHRS